MAKKFGVTDRGLAWELLNSVWILFSFVFCAFAGFFYIGYTAKQRKWVFWGCFYLAAWSLPNIEEEFPALSLPSWFRGVTLFFLIWLMGIVHTLLVRKEYLMRRDLVLKTGLNKSKERALRTKLQKEYTAQSITSSTAKRGKKHPQVPAADAVASVRESRFDINSCSEDELASLPGISAAMAKKACMYRQSQGDFASVDQFLEYLELKPHFVIQLRPRLVCRTTGAVDKTDKKAEPSGRVLDL